MPERVSPTENISKTISIIALKDTIVQLGPTSDSSILPLEKDTQLNLLSSQEQNTPGHLKLELISDNEEKVTCYLQIPEDIRLIILESLKGVENYSKLIKSESTPSIKIQLLLQEVRLPNFCRAWPFPFFLLMAVPIQWKF